MSAWTGTRPEPDLADPADPATPATPATPAAGTPPVQHGRGVLGHEIPAWLSADPVKRQLYGVDLYFREGWEEALAAAGSQAALREWTDTHSLVLVKPDAIAGRKLEACLAWLAANDITVVAHERAHATRHATRALWEYQWNIATRDRRELTELMMRQSACLLLLVRLPAGEVPASVTLAELKGPATASERQAHQLRSVVGTTNYIVNLAHTPDEPADVLRELSLLLDEPARARVFATLAGAAGVDFSRAPGVDPDVIVRAGYGQVEPEADLDYETRRRRWRLDVAGCTAGTARERDRLSRLLADPAAAGDWRAIQAGMLQLGLPWDEWDTVVLGTTLARAHVSGVVRMLPGVPVAAWLAHR